MRTPGIFDIDTPKKFFKSINKVFDRYKNDLGKSSEDILYVIMGLNHLREWIAPGFKSKDSPQNPAELASKNIYNDPDFDKIRKLCNHTKHAKSETTDTEHNVPIGARGVMSSWETVAGPPTKHIYDTQDMVDICQRVIDLYAKEFPGLT